MAGGTSYNGWPASDSPAAIGVEPFGDRVGLPFPGGVKAGDVATVMAYLCQQFHFRVEPIVSGWDWGYSYRANVNNPSQLSCHASGTAVDLNAPSHPNGTSTGPGGGGGFTGEQYVTICQILDELQGAVDWLESNDPMHFEIDVGAADLAAIAATLPASGPVPPPPDLEQDVITQLYVKGTDGAVYVTADLVTRVHVKSGDRLADAVWNAANVPGPDGPVVRCYMLSGGKWKPFTDWKAQSGQFDTQANLDQFGQLTTP